MHGAVQPPGVRWGAPAQRLAVPVTVTLTVPPGWCLPRRALLQPGTGHGKWAPGGTSPLLASLGGSCGHRSGRSRGKQLRRHPRTRPGLASPPGAASGPGMAVVALRGHPRQLREASTPQGCQRPASGCGSLPGLCACRRGRAGRQSWHSPARSGTAGVTRRQRVPAARAGSGSPAPTSSAGEPWGEPGTRGPRR